MFVTLLLSVSNHAVYLPNVILSVSSLPSELVPYTVDSTGFSTVQWLLSCIPLFISKTEWTSEPSKAQSTMYSLDRETLVILYPLHHALCVTLHYLTTTSLLRAELQLLSISLINVLILSTSPQAVILKALLWGGGVGTLVMCSQVLRWVVTLARVPRWRFRRAHIWDRHSRFAISKSQHQSELIQIVRDLVGIGKETSDSSSDDENTPRVKVPPGPSDLISDLNMNGFAPKHGGELYRTSAIDQRDGDKLPTIRIIPDQAPVALNPRQRRHTLPSVSQPAVRSSRRTPSGRRKRSASSSIQHYFSLTELQATVRKWIYAGYVYVCVLCIILVGIRPYIGESALNGSEPIGWALGYLFGNVPWFRMEVMTANIERWICLPDRLAHGLDQFCQPGWVEHLRQTTIGPANARLVLCAYWLMIIIVGLAVVFRLSAIYEVDTRRKVFHFMMVAMLLPATYIDPTFASLALSLMLAIFLILDLFRASQLPPLSKPLAYFLTPYVDGRDLRGPVVISHIFLLIGCAIPLWLSLAALPRSGKGCSKGWEVDTRDVSMVSGVICVGMGDAAASLIGRRYGRHKWFWSGGKSIEGSLAFATAVGTALILAKAWLRIGGWLREDDDNWAITVQKAGLAAGLASLTEAVLTGGNDNVVVPVVLWLCVKGLRI
jgi:dolichol kinase